MATVIGKDFDEFLDTPLYAWDTSTMLNGLLDYLDFSERNLDWQRKRGLAAAEAEYHQAQFEDKQSADMYRDHLLESAKYRFDVGLAQSVRYAGLVAFVVSIEKCSKALRLRSSTEFGPAPKRKNRHVHLLWELNRATSSGFEGEIEALFRLVRVRNCLVHAAGFIEGYEYESSLREDIGLLDGFEIWRENFLGESVRINRAAVDNYARGAEEWLKELHKACFESGLVV